MNDRPTGRVLVTGASGRLGRIVADRFHAAGHDVLGTDIVEATDPPFAFEQADLRDHEHARRLLEGVDTLLHIGNLPGIGPTPPQVVFNHNITINQNMFQGAAEQGVTRIVFASTLQLIGSWVDDRTVRTPPSPPSYPLNGSTPADPSNVYALSKTLSEQMLRYYADRCRVDAVALRFPLLHPAGDTRTSIGAGEETPTAIFEGFTSLTYEDAARLFEAVIDADLRGYHVFMPGNARRHRDKSITQLIDDHYPDLDPTTPDLIDNDPITTATGWRPSEPS